MSAGYYYVTEVGERRFEAVDMEGRPFWGSYHAQLRREYLSVGDVVTALYVARGGCLQGTRREMRPPDVLPDKATASICAVLPTYAFAQDEDGANYIVPRNNLAVHQEITGTVEAGLSGVLPVLIPT